MAYVKHIWRTGEPIVAEPLNNLEDGIFNEEARALEAEEILDNKINTNKSACEDGIETENIRATEAEALLSQRINELNMSFTSLKNYVDATSVSTYKACGSIYFADLPALNSNNVGNVYNIKDAFVTTEDFYEGAGISYAAGNNVAIIQIENIVYSPYQVESGENPHDLGLYEYDSQTDTYFFTEDTSPVSGKTYYFKNSTFYYYYDVLAAAVDTSAFVKYTDIATNSRIGICKPDGNSVIVNDRGTFYVNLRNPRDANAIIENLSLAIHHAELKRYGFDIGDWFDGEHYRYFIAGYNPFYGSRSGASDAGSSICLEVDHIALVFLTGRVKWHESSTSIMDVGYAGSDYQNYLETTVMDNVKEDMIGVFGGETGLEYLRDITKYFRGRNDETSLSRKRHQYISALTERQVYGSSLFSKDPLQTGEAYEQLEIFQKYLPVMSLEGGFWLRDIASETSACCVNDTGMPGKDIFGVERNGAAMIIFR